MKKNVIIILLLSTLLSSCTANPGKGTSADHSSGTSVKENSTASKDEKSSSAAGTLSNSDSQSSSKTNDTPKPTDAPEVAPTEEVGSDGLTDKAKQLGITPEMLTRSIVSGGDEARIANAMKKAQRGETVTIGVIGGSITQGAGASGDDKTYARQVENWWKSTFKNAKIQFVNAGLGATSSVIGVHRMGADLLSQKPDFVIVEFAVNDGNNALFKETYENVVRRVLKSPGDAGVLLLFMMDSQGNNAQYTESKVGKHYNLPMISYKDAMWPEITNKKFTWTDLSPDTIHPNDKGHAIAAELVKNYLRKVYSHLDSVPAEIKPVPAPLVSDKYANAQLLTGKTITASSLGSFTATDDAFWQFKDGWKVKGGTSPIVFNVKAQNVFLLFKKTNNGTGGKVNVKVDNGAAMTIDSDFPNGWGEYAETFLVCSDSKSADRKIEIALAPNGAKDEFILLGFLVY